MHNRLYRILCAVALVAVVPAAVFASSSRVAGLNVPGDYIKDYSGIYTYLSGVGSVGNLVYVEPNQGNEAMGAVLGNLWEGRLGTWGVHLHHFTPGLGQGVFGDPVATTIPDPNFSGEAFDLMWGHKLGTGSLGLRLNRSFRSNETAAGTAEGNGGNQRNIWGIGAGFGFAMNSNTDIELSGLFQNRSFKGSSNVTPDAAADDGGATYQVSGRAMMKAGGNMMMVPVVKLYSFDESSVSNLAVKTDQKLSGWQVGLAGNWSIGSDDLFVLGAQLVGDRFEQTVGAGTKTTNSEAYYPNVFMGLETHVNSWLTLRFGAQNAMLYSAKNEVGPLTQTIKDHRFTYNMGAGAKLGSLMLDATLDKNFWNDPISGTFNSGNSGLDDSTPFPRVSATYSF